MTMKTSSIAISAIAILMPVSDFARNLGGQDARR